ncbi:LPS assembly lipoprotein LptE [Pelagibius marinus]|uniref:LPS assembly lipoprotein LptE n=1 Tax=Pelagibius marinus TaxID=2762760 RepID=UPI001872B42D|nr:LPS assembly lipoprotein LptE [Pelagibius marinus]
MGLGGLATLALGGLGACGFQPLHQRQDSGSSVAADLSAVRVEPLRDRVGQQMHNFLRDRLNPQGQPAAPSYRLRVQITEKLSELGVRRDETATRANLRINAQFSLVDFSSGAPLFSGRSTSTTSYDILENPYATTVSEDDARERALREVADDIQTRLSIYFTRT